MNWTAVQDLLSMTGHGPYLWAAYGVTAALMAAEPWLVRRHLRRACRGAAAQPAQG